ITLNFTKGNGMRRIVIIRANAPVNENPADTGFYNANPVFGTGSQIGSGNFVVYADTGSSVKITGLTFGTNYFYSIYEYNGIGGYSNYLLTAPLTGFSKVGLPASEAPQFNFVGYPNPFHSAIQLDFELLNPSSVTIVVYDILGREIKSGSFGKMPKGQNQLLLDETYFGNPGTYYIRIYFEGGCLQNPAVKY
ncbi:MAG: T9SS type A sorting domain-containing protein, partial [Bacteroidota bacterium]|nr:T9SS type A sorting domain-containing protein [Bacteroidota bacterium]